MMERTLTSPACAYAPEFASRVGAILAALLALIARRLAGHPLLAPLSHRLTAIAEEFERLLADLAAHRLSCRHTGPRPHPETLRRPNPSAGWVALRDPPTQPAARTNPPFAPVGCVALPDPPTPPPDATTRTTGPSAGVPQPSPVPPPLRTSPGGLPRDRLPAPPPRSRASPARPTRTARLMLRCRNYIVNAEPASVAHPAASGYAGPPPTARRVA